MFLSRLSLVDGATRTTELWRTFTSPYAVHQAVWRLFPREKGGERDFLYRIDTVDGRPQVWTLSAREPQRSELWRPEVKPISPVLAAGDLLEVAVRVNPVVTRAKQRHDVVMDLKKRLGYKDLDPAERPTSAELVQQGLSEWIVPRAEKAGFRVKRLIAEGYRQESFADPKQAGRKAEGKKHEVALGLCDLDLMVEVVDPEAFLATWRQGLGPAKGFGCGLMLLKRARP